MRPRDDIPKIGCIQHDCDECHARLKHPDYDPLDELLIVACLAPRQTGETVRDAILRLIAWEVQIALDPAVSKAAQDLINRGNAPSQEPAAPFVGESWRALTETLFDVAPDWTQADGSAIERACAAIRRLAAPRDGSKSTQP